MRLITEKGQLVLGSDFKFEVEQSSPAFSHEGTQSLPVTLPGMANDALLDFPVRTGRNSKFLRKMAAKLEAGVIHKDGQLVIDTAHKKSGIVGALMLNESDFYSQIKDVKLVDIFGKITRNDFAASPDPVAAWYEHIYQCMIAAAVDDFTAFPVAVNLADGKYQLLNGPDITSARTIWDLRYQARRVSTGSETINVPAGYGITPFLFLHRVIDMIFAEYNYVVRTSPFRTHSLLNKIVVINNTADSICKGFVNYSDLVPSITVGDFLKFLENKFLIHAYIYPESKSVDLLPLNSVLLTPADMDLTGRVNDSEKYIYTDTQEVDITSDTSIEGAQPAMETLFDLAGKYTHLGELTEPDFRNNAWKYNFVLRRSTGEYYEILRKPSTSAIQINKIGSNYFRYFTKRMPAKEYKAEDLMPAMVEVKLGILGSKEANVVCPFIGNSRHRNTSYKEKTEDAEQKIILALRAGVADEDNNIAAKYCLGTTQKYNNLGYQWSDYDLTTTDLYQIFFKEWNRYLMNSGVEIEARVDYTTEELLSLRLDKPKLLKGQKVLLKSLSYAVGRKVENIRSNFLLLRALTPETADLTAQFAEQLYTWQYESNADQVFAEFDTQEYSDYTWDYIGPDAPSAASFEYIPAPTAAQYQSGTLYYYQENPILIKALKPGDSTIYEFERVLNSGFRAVLI